MSDTSPSPAIEFLLITDQSDFVWIIKDLLQEINLRNLVHTVGCSSAAVDYLGNLEQYIDTPIPGLILVGPDCQQKNGFNVIEAIKADPVLKETPVVLFTSMAYDEQPLTNLHIHADCVITRPNRARKLLLAIEQLGCFSITTITETADNAPVTYSIVVPNPLGITAMHEIHC